MRSADIRPGYQSHMVIYSSHFLCTGWAYSALVDRMNRALVDRMNREGQCHG